jgi:anti-anti-sigma factor
MVPKTNVPLRPDDEARVQPLRVTMAHPDPDTTVVTPAGEADLCTADDLRRALDEAADAGRPRVVVDLDRLDFMDASALSVLLEARRRMAAAGGVLQVRCHTRIGLLLLRSAGMGDLLEP